MATLPSNTVLGERIRGGIDVEYMDSLYKQHSYVVGEPWNRAATAPHNNNDGQWPDYPDIVNRTLEIGASRVILNNQFIGFTKQTFATPKPTFPELDEVTATVRQQFFLKRWRGTGRVAAQWSSHTEPTIWDGRGLGIGFTKVCAVTNPETGKQFVTLQHYPVWHVVYDPHVRNPYEARWICFLTYLDPDEAAEKFGEKARDKKVRLQDDYSGLSFDVVKVYEYYDVGIGGKKPCMAVYLGDLNSEPEFKKENPYNGCLPVALYTHLLIPQVRRPVGRIVQQIALQEARNQAERQLREYLKQFPAEVIDPSKVDPDDLREYIAGRKTKLKLTGVPEGPVITRTAAPEIPQTLLQQINILDRELTASSGITDAERGNLNPTQRTATENQLIDSRSQVGAGRDRQQTLLYYTHLVEKVLEVARLFDRDPVLLDIEGQNIVFNDPAEPASFIKHFLEEPSVVLIDTTEMDADIAKAEKAQEMALLNQLFPFVGTVIKPEFVAERALKALGVQNVDEALIRKDMTPAMPGAEGQQLPPEIMSMIQQGGQPPLPNG